MYWYFIFIVHPFSFKISAWCAIVYRALSKHERNKLAMAILLTVLKYECDVFFLFIKPQEQTKPCIHIYTLTESDFVFNLSPLYIFFFFHCLTTSVSILIILCIFGCFVKFFSFTNTKANANSMQTIV